MYYSKITQFDRLACSVLADAIRRALEPVAAEYGLTLTMRGGSFGATNYQPKMEFAVVSADGIVLTREAQDFKSGASLYGLRPEDLGATFIANGKTYRVTGLAARSSTRPILCDEPATGKTFKFKSVDVARLLSLARATGRST